MSTCLPFTEETLDDALSIVRVRFGEGACSQARLLLRNPCRGLCPSAGDIVYDANRPEGFQAAILRRGYIDNLPFIGVVGGMLAMHEGASPVLLLALMKKTIASRGGSILFFANTSIPVSMKMNRMLGVTGKGIPSCGVVRFAVVRLGSFVNFVLKGCLPGILVGFGNLLGMLMVPFFYRRSRSSTSGEELREFSSGLFDVFWARYLEGNDGVVLSRTTEELEWAFGEDVRKGRDVLLVRRDASGLVGYVILRAKDEAQRRWLVVDWIALKNDRAVLSDLLKDAVRWLRKHSHAVFLESIGFRMDVQDVIHRHLPFTRKAPNNTTIFKAGRDDLREALSKAGTKGWFFGPYDGDRCIA